MSNEPKPGIAPARKNYRVSALTYEHALVTYLGESVKPGREVPEPLDDAGTRFADAGGMRWAIRGDLPVLERAFKKRLPLVVHKREGIGIVLLLTPPITTPWGDHWVFRYTSLFDDRVPGYNAQASQEVV